MNPVKHNSALTERAQKLRRDATRQEKHLWYNFLSSYPIRFRRQATMDSYIVDFYCHQAKLVIELDGSQHYEEEGMDYDTQRTAVLEGHRLKVLRFSNLDIDRNFRGVCEYIDIQVKEREK